MGFIYFIAFLFLSPSLWAMGHVPSDKALSPLIGKLAPDINLPKSDGTSGSVIASGDGQDEILIFWTTWCSNCYEELGSLYENMDGINHNGVKIILIDLAESKDAVDKYFDQRQMKWTSFLDVDQYLQQQYHLVGIPTLVFIDKKGIIRNITHQFPSDYQDYFGS